METHHPAPARHDQGHRTKSIAPTAINKVTPELVATPVSGEGGND
jgi:hypothetical protein